jgi:threonine/homoserine/homoserine lactone efflux protein
MLPAHLLWPFLLATFIFAAMPGPAVLYSAAQTLSHGRRFGFMTVVGIHAGGYVYVAATALGLSVLLHCVPTVYTVVKLVGAAYLVWLGVGVLRQKSDPEKVAVRTRRSASRAFRDGFTVELLNPKTALFFVAFLPQFVDPTGSIPATLQLLLLGILVNGAFSCADVVSVFLASTVAGRFKRNGWEQRLARIVSGSILIGLGVRLASSRN